MIGFRYYFKDDKTKETIASWPANNLDEATERFASIKRMSVKQFQKLYIVERYDRP